MERLFTVDSFKAIGATAGRISVARDLIDVLAYFDPHQLTYNEFSFKVRGDKIFSDIRFLNMDANSYSCKNAPLFLSRLDVFEAIISKYYPISGEIAKAIAALRQMAKTPVDIYFGADIMARSVDLAFWLVFGGMKRTGEVVRVGYDIPTIIKKAAEVAGFSSCGDLSDQVVNLGFDITGAGVKYKLYYLCQDGLPPRSVLGGLYKQIRANLTCAKYFYFRSEMYDQKGCLIKEKLFIEFMEDIYNRRGSKIAAVVNALSKIPQISLNKRKTLDVVLALSGRTSLIAFEPDGTTTFYLRPR